MAHIYQYHGGPKDGTLETADEERLFHAFDNGTYTVAEGEEILAGVVNSDTDDVLHLVWRSSH